MASRKKDPLSVEESAGGEGEEREESGAAGHRSWEPQIPVKLLRGHSDAVTAARLCCEDRCVLSCSADCTAALWDVASGRRLRTFEGVHSKPISECAQIPHGHRMVTVSWDKKMAAWDLETGHTLWTAPQPGLLTSCSASSDGRFVVCASDPQNGVYVCDAASGQTLQRVTELHRSTVTRCRFDPQSQRVAMASADRSVKVWDLQAQKTTVSVDSNHSNVVSDCCFTTNGHFLCTASWDKTLKLWDLQAGGFRSHGGTPLQRGHDGSVSSCCFSADANLLASGSYDRTVALWDMSSLCQTLILKGHSDWVTDVSLSADRKLVASSSKDRTVRLWDIRNMEDVPEVMQKRTEGTGVHMLKCEECGKPFPVCRLQTSDQLTRCVFCRLKSPSRYRPQPPPVM
ncbi:WD repeat-containing protein 88-like [Parambassis ranga]|uniref:WD repeat-containing protein 88-like n=1 Tax=Parambassis ranga TaxID=210632 RepID=A0A6P7HQQ7_9TELE|nr:WD repeat-containing protein 88 [Parambassis ranga]